MSYKVEHMDTKGVWHKSHRGVFKTYTEALQCRDRVGAFGRVMADYEGRGIWEEVRRPAHEPRGVAFGKLRSEKTSGGFGGPFPKGST